MHFSSCTIYNGGDDDHWSFTFWKFELTTRVVDQVDFFFWPLLRPVETEYWISVWHLAARVFSNFIEVLGCRIPSCGDFHSWNILADLSSAFFGCFLRTCFNFRMIFGLLPAHFDFARFANLHHGLALSQYQPERSAQKEVWVRKKASDPASWMTPRQFCRGWTNSGSWTDLRFLGLLWSHVFFFCDIRHLNDNRCWRVDCSALEAGCLVDSTEPYTSLGAWEIWEFLFVRLNISFAIWSDRLYGYLRYTIRWNHFG